MAPPCDEARDLALTLRAGGHHRGVVRIVSLVPSGTDLVAALGLGEALVGVSHECDHPLAEGLPRLTRSNVPAAPEVAPAEVDRAVSEAVGRGDSLYVTDRAKLAELAPDVVISQDICDVCAVEGSAARAAVPEGAALVMLSATTVEGLYADLHRVGAATGRPESARAEIERVEGALKGLPQAPPRRVVTLEWSDPPFLGGHWVPELVARAGGRHLLAGPGHRSRRATWDEVRDAAPDLAVFLPCGYPLDAAVREAEACAPLRDLGVETWATNATRLFSRCTPGAVVRGAQTLSAIFTGGSPDPTLARRVS